MIVNLKVKRDFFKSETAIPKSRQYVALELLINRILIQASNNVRPCSKYKEELFKLSNELDIHFRELSVTLIILTGSLNQSVVYK